jgi:hypothetical protein
LIKFSLSNITTKPLLQKEINVYQVIASIYGREVINFSNNIMTKSTYLFYKEPLEESLQIVKHLLTNIFNIKLIVQLHIEDKILMIKFSMIPIETLTFIKNQINFFELQLLLYINKGKFSCTPPTNDFQDICLSFPLHTKL